MCENFVIGARLLLTQELLLESIEKAMTIFETRMPNQRLGLPTNDSHSPLYTPRMLTGNFRFSLNRYQTVGCRFRNSGSIPAASTSVFGEDLQPSEEDLEPKIKEIKSSFKKLDEAFDLDLKL